MKAKQQQQAHKNEATSAERPDPHVSIGAGWLIEEEESREARDKTVHARARARGSERTNATQRARSWANALRRPLRANAGFLWKGAN